MILIVKKINLITAQQHAKINLIKPTKSHKPSNLNDRSCHHVPKSSLPLKHLHLPWLSFQNSSSFAAFWREAFSVVVLVLTGTAAVTIRTRPSSYFQKIFGENCVCLSDIFVANRQSCGTQSSLYLDFKARLNMADTSNLTSF